MFLPILSDCPVDGCVLLRTYLIGNGLIIYFRFSSSFLSCSSIHRMPLHFYYCSEFALASAMPLKFYLSARLAFRLLLFRVRASISYTIEILPVRARKCIKNNQQICYRQSMDPRHTTSYPVVVNSIAISWQ